MLGATPNVHSLKFLPGRDVMGDDGTMAFPDFKSTQCSALARTLFKIEGVTGVFLGKDFVTVTKRDTCEWSTLTPQVFGHIAEFYATGQPVVSEVALNPDTAINDDDSEVVAMIKELLDERVRPTVQEDGGDIYFDSFDPDTGVVFLRMVGACDGCSSASITLKNGVENMMKHYIPDVKEVRQVESELEAQGNAVLREMEEARGIKD